MIKQFNEIGKDDILTAGGKGANLGEMTGGGLNVPDGFVITSDAYRHFLNENGLSEKIDELLTNAGSDESKLFGAAENIRTLICASELPQKLKKCVEVSYTKLCESCGKRVAVRSSATAEDLPDASFAGQQETYLNVMGLDELYKSIVKCYASLWGNRAVSYRSTQGYDQKSVALAVVVQQMVESEKAGVLFTADPVNNSRSEMQLNAAYGLGEAVVSGKVTADTFICDKNGNVKSSVMGSKEIQIVYADKGTKEIPVSDEMKKRFCLDDNEIKMLCNEAVKVEDHYGCPMDIEWAIQGAKAYILQARAITTLGAEIDESIVDEYVSRCHLSGALKSNFAFLLEKMPAVYYPMDIKFCAAINDQKENIFAEIGVLMSMDPQVDNDGIMLLPPNKKRINGKIVNFPRVFKEITDYQECVNKLETKLAKYQKSIDTLANLKFDKMSISQCGENIKRAYTLVEKIAYARFRYALFPGVVGQRGIERILKKISPELTGYDIYSDLDNKTAVVTRDIGKLAEKISENKLLKNDVMSGKSYADIIREYPDIADEFEKFMRKNGMKSDYNCYCIYARTFVEEPDRLLNIIRPLIVNPMSEEENKFDPLMESVKKHCGEKKYNAVRSKIDCLRKFHLAREESQYQWECVFYYIRKMLARASELLTGNADTEDGIAYLFLTEFYAACERGYLSEADKENIARRKGNRPLAERVWEHCKMKVFESDGDVLKGVSGSSGEYTGRVCIIHGPEEFYKLNKGDILVCPLTDPEWTPLFKVAGAVVADTGAALSHAAIVAREYGIPAVLGVGFATTKYKDGDTICVNGTKGEVTLIG